MGYSYSWAFIGSLSYGKVFEKIAGSVTDCANSTFNCNLIKKNKTIIYIYYNTISTYGTVNRELV